MKISPATKFLYNDKGNLTGINLAADFVAEHESGITGIKELLGVVSHTKFLCVERPVQGIERRKIRTSDNVRLEEVPEGLLLRIENEHWFKIVSNDQIVKDLNLSLKSRETWGVNKGDKGLIGAWTDTRVRILATSSDAQKKLTKLYTSIQNHDMVIMMGGGGLFENKGLVFAIASDIPKDIQDKWLADDKEAASLKKDAEATGIAKRLQKAGIEYFALSPQRPNADSEKVSKYNVRFWLNPRHQNKYNCGWFTVEELDLWIQGKGPVIMTEKQKRKNQRT